jgi:hypothetical protein
MAELKNNRLKKQCTGSTQGLYMIIFKLILSFFLLQAAAEEPREAISSAADVTEVYQQQRRMEEQQDQDDGSTPNQAAAASTAPPMQPAPPGITAATAGSSQAQLKPKNSGTPQITSKGGSIETIRSVRAAMLEAPGLYGGVLGIASDIGSFGGSMCPWGKSFSERTNFPLKKIIGLSFDPVTLACGNCDGQHGILNVAGGDGGGCSMQNLYFVGPGVPLGVGAGQRQ